MSAGVAPIAAQDPLEGEITLWHTYSSGAGTELDALNQVIANVGAANPGPRAIDMLTIDRPTLDFTQLAKGMGVPGAKAHDLEELTKQLTYAMSQKGPYLIDVVM